MKALKYAIIYFLKLHHKTVYKINIMDTIGGKLIYCYEGCDENYIIHFNVYGCFFY